jgi:hypothetical protein
MKKYVVAEVEQEKFGVMFGIFHWRLHMVMNLIEWHKALLRSCV